jgi:tetratricopeptide (TPR) repeat protein
MRHVLLTLFVLLAASSGASAQTPAPPPASSPSAAAAPQAESLLEQKHIRARFEKDGTSERVMKLRARVATEQAVRDWGQLPLNYMPDVETLTVTRVRVEKADGSVIADATGSVQDVALRPPTVMPVFLDLRQKVIAVTSLRPGDVLEVEAKWTVHKALAANHYWFEYSFVTGGGTVLDERLELDVPADSKAIVRVKPGAPSEQNGGRVEGGRRIYRWASKHEASSRTDEESRPVERDKPVADVRLTTFQTWEEIASWYAGLSATPPDPEVTARALELTRGLSDRAARIDAIYGYVAKEIRYLSLSFGLGRFAPHPPAEVLKNKYGDCKDKAALLSAMLAAVGIDSLPVLLHTQRSLDDTFASPEEIDHVITIALEGDEPSRSTWMDATTEIAPVGMLGAQIRDRRVLIVGGGRHATKLARTPMDPPTPWVDTVDVRGTIDAIGTLNASLLFTLQGDSEYLARTLIRIAPAEAMKEFVRGMAQDVGFAGTYSNESASDPGATKKPMELRVTVRVPGFLDWAAAKSELKTPPRTQMLYGSEADRKGLNELLLGSPYKSVMRASFELPPGYTLQAPLPVALSGEGFTYSSKYVVDGTRVAIERVLDGRSRRVPAARFGAYSAFVGAMESDLAQVIRVEGAIAAAPSIPSEATASELYSAAYNAYRADKFAAAAALWARATEVDPKMVSAWNSLGLAYDRLREYPKAVAAYEKVLALDPFDKRTYADLGRARRGAGQLNEAAAAFAKHLEINPTDADVMVELGTTLSSLRRYADAAAALEKAATAGTLTAWGYAVLGEAYLHQKQADKAVAAFDRALAMSKSPAPALWTKIGWVLADNGHDAERARSLALQTLTHAKTVMKDIEASGVTDARTNLMEHVAWSWDALAILAYRNGQLDEAERYARAAWRLGREWDMAMTLGRVYEKRGRLSDAATYYLTAYAIARRPSEALEGHVRQLLGGDEAKLKPMLPSASLLALSLIRLPDTLPKGRARYTVVVGTDGRVVDLMFKDGDESIKALEKSLREIKPDVEFPPDAPPRLALILYVGCAEGQGCAVTSVFPPDVMPRR